MKLSESESKTLLHAKSDLRIWVYARYLLLVLAVGSVVLSFGLIYEDPYFLTGLGCWIRGLLLIAGILLGTTVLRCWSAPKSRLLVKLADNAT